MVSDMSNSVSEDSNEIDESGFDLDSNDGNEKKAAAPTSEVTTEEVEARTSRGTEMANSKKKLIITGLALATIVSTGFIYFGLPTNQESDTVFQIAAVDPIESNDKPILLETSKPESSTSNLSVEQDPSGVLINGHHDLIASMLLQNYPTREELRQELSRVRGADVSKEELDVFLLSVKNNADDIRQIKAGAGSSVDAAEIRNAISDIRSMVEQIRIDSEEQKSQIVSMQKNIDKFQKNSGWYHNRISRLEGNPLKTTQSKKENANVTSDVRRVEMKAQSAWSVNGASDNLAFIENIHSGKRLRITRGFDVPGCGQVTDISPSDQKVTTTTCVISN
jgi:hypothetical protein